MSGCKYREFPKMEFLVAAPHIHSSQCLKVKCQKLGLFRADCSFGFVLGIKVFVSHVTHPGHL